MIILKKIFFMYILMFIRIGTSILGIYSEVSYSPECRIGGINFLKNNNKISFRFIQNLFHKSITIEYLSM